MKQDKGTQKKFEQTFWINFQARILCFLFGFFGQSFYQREIMYETGLSLRPVQRELNNLVHLGIVKKQTTRNRIYYGINPDSTFFEPLRAICGSIPEKGLLSIRYPKNSQSDFIFK